MTDNSIALILFPTVISPIAFTFAGLQGVFAIAGLSGTAYLLSRGG